MTKRERSWVAKIIALLMGKPARKVFEARSRHGKKIVAYEYEISMRPLVGSRKGQIEEIALLESGTKRYLLVQDASSRYGLSPSRIRTLCREKRISCQKKSGRWLVLEDSLRKYSTAK